MDNPFKYVTPEKIKELRELDRKSGEFRNRIKELRGEIHFELALKAGITDNMTDEMRENAHEMVNASRIGRFFQSISVLTIASALLCGLLWRDTGFSEYIKYLIAAGVVSILFVWYQRGSAGRYLAQCAGVLLDIYKLPDETRFPNELVKKLIEIKTSKKDVIFPEEREQKIPCGCYSCMRTFTSDELDGEQLAFEYTCPHCDQSTIISERCGYEITEELLKDMHDYWLR